MGQSWHVDGLSVGPAGHNHHAQAAVTAHSEEAPMLRTGVERSDEHRSQGYGALTVTPTDTLDEEIDSSIFTEVVAPPPKQHKWIILPNSQFRRIWVQVTLFVALYIIWVTPVRVGFNMQAQGPWFWIEGIIDIFFYMDLVLNFFTAYEHPATSELITEHKRIAKRYLRSWFWIDLLATFPSDYIVKGIQGTWGCSFRDDCDPSALEANSAASAIVLLRTMRIFRIFWIFKNFNILSSHTFITKLMDEFMSVRWLLSILELGLVLVFLAHLTGCFFYMFSHPVWQTPVEKQLLSEGLMTTWVLDKMGGYEITQMPELVPNVSVANLLPNNTFARDPSTGNWYVCNEFYFIYVCGQCKGMQLRCQAELGTSFRYITAMYWAYTTMTTVGYGDIFATTVAEKIWAILTMVIGGFFLSFCFGRIASIVGRLDADRAARAEQIESITQFLKDYELPKDVSRKVLNFYKTNVKSVKPYDRSQVLARLPFDLRLRILQHMYDTCIKNIPMLDKICTDDPAFMADFTMHLAPYHSSADTYVYHRGELSADLYILVRGDIFVMGEDQHSKWVKIPEGSIFGEAGIVKQLNDPEGTFKRGEDVKCETPCDMLRMSLDEAMSLCEAYPELARGLKRLHRVRQQQLTSAAYRSTTGLLTLVAATTPTNSTTSTVPTMAGVMAAGRPAANGSAAERMPPLLTGGSFMVQPSPLVASLPGSPLPARGALAAGSVGGVDSRASAGRKKPEAGLLGCAAAAADKGGSGRPDSNAAQELQQELGAMRRAQADLQAELIQQRALLQQLPAALAAHVVQQLQQRQGSSDGGGVAATAAEQGRALLPLGTHGSLKCLTHPGSPSLL